MDVCHDRIFRGVWCCRWKAVDAVDGMDLKRERKRSVKVREAEESQTSDRRRLRGSKGMSVDLYGCYALTDLLLYDRMCGRRDESQR